MFSQVIIISPLIKRKGFDIIGNKIKSMPNLLIVLNLFYIWHKINNNICYNWFNFQEINELKMDLDVCRHRLDAKYQAIAVLQKQVRSMQLIVILFTFDM